MDVKQFTAGMVTDLTEKSQPPNTYRFALNAILEGRQGKLGSILSEEGNDTVVSVTAGHTVIGHVLTNTEDIILFTTDNTTSEIGIFNPDSETYTVIISETCLGFSTQHPIKALFRIRKGCERTIYFTDRVNPYRTINLDDLSQYQDTAGNIDCNKVAFTKPVSMPSLEIVQVNDFGGQLDVGSYQFAVRYLDTELNATNWFYTSNPVWIYDEGQDATYDAIDGAIPLVDNAEGVIGGVPATTKSIDLSISGLDTTYTYVQLAVLQSTATTGTISTIYVQPEIFIESLADNTLTYTYRGPDATSTTLTDLSDIVVDKLNIGVVQTHTQLDNRLWLAGISSTQYDYAALQRAANDITTSWVTTPVPLLDSGTPGNTKNPLTPASKMSMMGDEVYALAIQFLHSSGEWTPAFHIPGRESVATDTLAYTANANTTHLGTDSTYPTWQVKSTAASDGTLGYYEAELDYPTTLACDGERIFPTGKIRHHRMPSRDIIQVNDTTSSYPIGLEFDNVTYPSTSIVGHRFLVSIRNESNSTVVDGGITIPLKYEVNSDRNLAKFEYLSYENKDSYGEFNVILLSPKILTELKLQNFDHLRFNYALERSSTLHERVYDSGLLFDKARIRLEQIGHQKTGTLFTDLYNRAIQGSAFVKPRSKEEEVLAGFNSKLDNVSFQNTFNFVAWDEDERLTDSVARKHKYVTLKRTLYPYSDLESIQYRPLHANPKTLISSQEVYGGDVVISDLSISDVHIANDTEKVHGNLIGRTFVESTINFGLTYGTLPQESVCDAKWKPATSDWENDEITDQTFQFFEDIYLEEDNNKWTLAPDTNYCLTGMLFHYNDDYSKLNVEKTYFQLPRTFNYCSSCINEYPYRLMYSEKSFQEESADNYRTFLANNYNDFLGKEGAITNLFIDKDQLYALTARALWFVPTRPQQLTTNEATVYVGTGEVLSIPPKRMSTSDHSYGGTTEQLSLVSTEFGTIYVDTVGRKIFLLSDSLKEISQNGLNNFFEDNIDLVFPQQFKRLTTGTYQYTNPTYTNGVGYITTYDPRYKRFLIHKKDFELLESKYRDTPLSGFISYDSTTGQFMEGEKVIQVGDPKYFIDRSWTLSYSLKHRTWASYHSIMPYYMFHDEDQFFSHNNTNKIWAHNTVGKSCSYYGQIYPHIIDFISNKAPVTTQVFKSLYFHSDVQEYFSSTRTSRIVDNETYQKIVLYNTDQTSGLRNIIRKGNDNPFVSVTSAPEDVIIEKSEGVWKLSNLRDYNSSHYGASLFTSAWSAIQDQYYIDKVPTPEITQISDKTLFDTQRFRDEWIGVRLYYTPSYSTYRMSTDLAGIQTTQSFR